jgi:nitrogen fixation/metabolism regulation signal transduction histidine kinase
LATTIGLACALAGAQLAARTLSRPVAELGAAALAVGQGRPLPRAHAPPTEFEAVFGAFDRMATDVRTSQQALEDARRRTATVLATVATGVIALDPDGRVLLANQRAEEMLGTTLPEGTALDSALGAAWSGLKSAVGRFLLDPGAAPGSVEFDSGGRRYRLQLAVPGADLRGVVIALDDLTDVTQAARVLAWGELARQVAHEVKNPLTPIRLGVQHLRRVYRDGHQAFAQTLDETSKRILAEIDRLDTIARAFSRFSAPVESRAPLEPVRLLDTVREVAALYSLGDTGSAIDLSGESDLTVAARKDEVKEVLGNLFENARHAGARRIRVEVAPGLMVVQDDGGGIAPDLLPRIFEPRFSTTTSGAGLGLAIVRRLVEGWGATIDVASEVGKGTRLEIRWGRPPS